MNEMATNKMIMIMTRNVQARTMMIIERATPMCDICNIQGAQWYYTMDKTCSYWRGGGLCYKEIQKEHEK